MWIGLLGSLQVRVDGAAVTVPAARQRALLAVLAVRAGELVSTDELAETLWDGMPPPRAADTIRNYVKRLRLRLGAAGRRIVACRPGYRLEVAEDELDLRVFTRLCRDGGVAVRAGDWAAGFGGLGQALGLWRGAPFADVGCERLAREQAPLLSELRWLAAEWRAEAGLALGRHAELAGELAGWCAAEPLRERFAALRMLALYRSGRQSDALAAYQQARRLLADELGVEPGEELRRLHQQILARDPALAGPAERDTVPGGGCVAPAPEGPAEGANAARVVPRQLPAAVAGFVGRLGELEVLAGLAEQAVGGAGGAVLISAIGGTPGVGKTALAVRFAHQVAGLFPDGQLYADLRGFSPAGDPAASRQVLGGFLESLGVAPRAVPADVEAQAGLYRSVLAGRRVLVVLDNARDAAQVRPLVPGSGGCLVLVTSRSQLTGLAATGDARLLSLGLLTGQEARELLAGRVGAGRVEAEPQAADELVRLCARLPLALAITAARAAARPAQPLAALAAELREAGGLDALDAGEPVASVRAVFSWSYEQLSLPAARLFRLLGIHPGPDISAPAAASMAGVEPARARQLLAELAGAHLIAEHAPGRYAFHDLLRAYATEQAHAVDGDAERRAAAGRVLDHYLHTAYAAAVLVNPSRKSLSIAPPDPGVTSEHLAGQQQVLAWFEAEHRVLLAAAAHAAEAGFDRHAWQLAWAIADYLDASGHWHELAALQRSALAAATRLGEVGGQAAAHRALAGTCTQLATYDVAHAHLADSLELYRRLGDRAGEGRVHLTLGGVFVCQERYADALGSCEQALSLFQAIGGHQVCQARALHQVGWCCAQLGRHQEARAFCRQALSLLRELGHRSYEAESWHNLGDVEQKCGDHLAAAACYQRALGLFREFGDRYSQAMVLTHLGDAQHAAGQTQAARTVWHEAGAILDALHHPAAGQVRAKLGQDAEPSQTR